MLEAERIVNPKRRLENPLSKDEAYLTAFGNRTLSARVACSTNPAPTESYNGNNQLAGGLHGYDLAGNAMADATTGNQYLYAGVPVDRSSSTGRDGEGRVCAVLNGAVPGMLIMTGYLYDGVPVDRSTSTGRDAEGNRVAKGSITSFSCNTASNGFQPETEYVTGAGGEQLSELGADGNGNMIPQRTYVYQGGALMATYDLLDTSSANPYGLRYRLTDWLGTRRVQAAGAVSGCAPGVIEIMFQSLPFGNGLTPIPECSADDATEHHFTGKERDAESGNDYFGARYYASSMGRFMSPDPGPFVWRDPQTLNRYAYTRNNPLRYIDPTGKYFVVAAEMRQQVQNYISTMLRTPNGAASIAAIAFSNRPVNYGLASPAGSFNRGVLGRKNEGGGRWSITNGITSAVPGNSPGQVAGANVTLDNNNIAFTSILSGNTAFSIGLTAFAHEDNHVTDILAAPTLGAAAAAGAEGDVPSSATGTAETRAEQMMAQLGNAGQNFQPDAGMDALAASLLQLGDAMQSAPPVETQNSDLNYQIPYEQVQQYQPQGH